MSWTRVRCKGEFRKALRKTIKLLCKQLQASSVQDNATDTLLEVIKFDSDKEEAPVPARERARATTTPFVPLQFSAFNWLKKRDANQKPEAAKRAKTRAVIKIARAVLDECNTPAQQALALHLAMKHKDLQQHCQTAGIFTNISSQIDAAIVANLQVAIKFAIRTDQMKGRTSDDKRLFIHSIVLATLPPNGAKFSKQNMATHLGIPESTYG